MSKTRQKSQYETDWGVPQDSVPHIAPNNYESDWGVPQNSAPHEAEGFYPDQKPMGFLNRAGDAAGRFNKDFESIPGRVGNAIVKGLDAAPGQIYGAGHQMITDPLRTTQNLSLNGYNIFKTLANIPYEGRKYAAHLGLADPNNIEDTLHVPNNNFFEKGVHKEMGQSQPGDALLQNIVPIGQAAKIVSPLATFPLKMAGRGALSAIEDANTLSKNNAGVAGAAQSSEEAFNAAQQEHKNTQEQTFQSSGTNEPVAAQKKLLDAQTKLQDMYKSLSDNPPTSAKDHEMAQANISNAIAEYRAAKSAAMGELGVGSPNKIQYRINQSKAKLQELNQALLEGKPVASEDLHAAQSEFEKANAEHQEVKNAAESKFGRSSDNSLNLKINKNQDQLQELNQSLQAKPPEMTATAPNAPESLEPHENNIRQAEQNHEHAQQIAQSVDNTISHHLNDGEHHEVAGTRRMRRAINGVEEYWSNEYDNQMHDLERTNFQLLNPEREPQIREALDRARQEFGDDPHGDFGRVLRMAPDFASTSAHDFMRDQKQFRNGINGLYRQAQYEGRNGNPVRADDLFRAARALRPFEGLVNDTLREGLGEHGPRYDYIQNGYRTQIYPLRENRVAGAIRDGEPLSKNIAAQFAGDQEGQDLLRTMAKNNPEMLRTIVGQQKRESLYNPNEMIREYTNEMPQLNRMLDQRGQAQQAVSQSAQNIELARAAHTEASARVKEANQAQVNYAKEEKNFNTKREVFEAKKKQFEKQKGQVESSIDLLNKFKEQLKTTGEKKSATENIVKTLTKDSERNAKINAEIEKIKNKLPTLEEHRKRLQDISGQMEVSSASPKELIRQTAKREKIHADIQKIQDELSLLQNDRNALLNAVQRKDISETEMNAAKGKLQKIHDAESRMMTRVKTVIAAGFGLYGVTKFL